jgi:hypothetical protein
LDLSMVIWSCSGEKPNHPFKRTPPAPFNEARWAYL